MNVLKEVLRMRYACVRSQREIGSVCGLSVGAVNGLLQRAELAVLGCRCRRAWTRTGCRSGCTAGCPAGGRRRAGRRRISRRCPWS